MQATPKSFGPTQNPNSKSEKFNDLQKLFKYFSENYIKVYKKLSKFKDKKIHMYSSFERCFCTNGCICGL